MRIVLLFLASCTFSGHPALHPRGPVLPAKVVVCPSGDRAHDDLVAWRKRFADLGCVVPTVERGTCSDAPGPREAQVRSCRDILVGEFGRGCPLDYVDVVGIDKSLGRGVAYIDFMDNAPGRVGHVLGHILGLPDSTAGTSVMHPAARYTNTHLVVCP